MNSRAFYRPSDYIRTFPSTEIRMAPRQMKMPVKDNTDKEPRNRSPNASGRRADDICSRWIGRQRAPTKHRKPLTRRGSKSRQVIQSFKCRFMTASITRTPSWSYRALHRDEGRWGSSRYGATRDRQWRGQRDPYVGQALAANSPETLCRFAAGTTKRSRRSASQE